MADFCTLCGYRDMDVISAFNLCKPKQYVSWFVCESCGLEAVYRTESNKCVLIYYNFSCSDKKYVEFDIERFTTEFEKLVLELETATDRHPFWATVYKERLNSLVESCSTVVLSEYDTHNGRG